MKYFCFLFGGFLGNIKILGVLLSVPKLNDPLI